MIETEAEAQAFLNAIFEKPILFNGEMVKAILEGRKTMTRRVIKFDKLSKIKKGRLFYSSTFKSWVIENKSWTKEADIEMVKCPYGEVGDRLWVRETFVNGYEYDEDGNMTKKELLLFKADNPDMQWHDEDGYMVDSITWKPSIHMPRKLSRINLEITNVRVERVQDITDEAAVKEGITECPIPATGDHPEMIGYMAGPDDGRTGLTKYPIEAFEVLWDSINEKRGYGWSKNPFCWVLEFKVI